LFFSANDLIDFPLVQFGPLVLSGWHALLAIVGLASWWGFILTVSGTVAAWVYLRYFQPHDGGAFFGDASDAFSFDVFFPTAVQCVVPSFSFFFSVCKENSLQRQAGVASGAGAGKSLNNQVFPAQQNAVGCNTHNDAGT
jgi:hypothetical protein